MKRCFVLFLLLLLIACSEAPEDIESVDSETTTPEVETVRVKLLSRGFMFHDNLLKFTGGTSVLFLPDPDIEMITPVGEPTKVYRVRDDHLIQEEIISQEPLYHLVWGQLHGSIILMNVLENRIRYIPYDEAMDSAYDNLTEAQEARRDEIQTEEKAKWEKWKKENDENKEAPEERDWYGTAEHRWHREINPQPFDIHHHTGDFGDEIEVVIKHGFVLEAKNRAIGMIFVDVKRNISRPHITFR